jgi:hypothetical protein
LASERLVAHAVVATELAADLGAAPERTALVLERISGSAAGGLIL